MVVDEVSHAAVSYPSSANHSRQHSDASDQTNEDPFVALLLQQVGAASRRETWRAPNQFLTYANDVYSWMRRTEASGVYRIDTTYLERQKEINNRMRVILVDWLIDVHSRFKLVPETLFLAVNFLDRCLMAMPVGRE